MSATGQAEIAMSAGPAWREWSSRAAHSVARDVTVGVCTYRRPASLQRFLESLADQDPAPAETMIVDASPDARSEEVVHRLIEDGVLPGIVRYCRVGEPFRGLTRQRNIALDAATTELIAFFDDDIVLLPGALGALAEVHRTASPAPAGVGAVIVNELEPPSLRWRIRRMLGIVPTLAPGRYARSGMSVPWRFIQGDGPSIPGDWLPGGASMWRTDGARSCRFNTEFAGYGNGEDLEFSVRIREAGPLLMCPRARVRHLPDPAGRPDQRLLALSSVVNAWRIHQLLPARSARDVARFAYAHLVELALLLAGFVRHPSRDRGTYLTGYVAALIHIVRKGRR